MGVFDVFKSREEREKERKRAQRKAFREARKNVDIMKEKIGTIKEKREQAWQEARNYLKNGQKSAAERCMQTVRSGELLIDKLEKKYWVSEQMLLKLDLAKTDGEFAQSLASVQSILDIDPDAVADIFDEMKTKLGDQEEIEKNWDGVYKDEMKSVSKEGAEVVPSLEKMMKNLEEEVAMDVRESSVLEENESPESGLTDEIGAGRKRLRDLLGDEQ